MKDFYTIKEGQNGATVEILPNKEIRLSTKNIMGKMLGLGYEVVTETPFVIVMKRDTEVTAFPSGKLIIKNMEDESEIRSIVDEIYSEIISNESLGK